MKNSKQLHLACRKKAAKRKERPWSWMTFFQNKKRTEKRGWIERSFVVFVFVAHFIFILPQFNEAKWWNGKQSGPYCTTASITCCMNVYKCVRCVSMYSIYAFQLLIIWATESELRVEWVQRDIQGVQKDVCFITINGRTGFFRISSTKRNLANIHILIGIDDK